jgi:hypothetical protein
MEDKGDLWHQLANILDPRDPDDEDRPYSPILIEAVDNLEQFFSGFADQWRRGADKEMAEAQSFWGLELGKLRKTYDHLDERYKQLRNDHERATAALVQVQEKLPQVVAGAKAQIDGLQQQNKEAWDLIDEMLPWVVDYPGPVAGSPQRDALLAKIKEKRAHG